MKIHSFTKLFWKKLWFKALFGDHTMREHQQPLQKVTGGQCPQHLTGKQSCTQPGRYFKDATVNPVRALQRMNGRWQQVSTEILHRCFRAGVISAARWNHHHANVWPISLLCLTCAQNKDKNVVYRLGHTSEAFSLPLTLPILLKRARLEERIGLQSGCQLQPLKIITKKKCLKLGCLEYAQLQALQFPLTMPFSSTITLSCLPVSKS